MACVHAAHCAPTRRGSSGSQMVPLPCPAGPAGPAGGDAECRLVQATRPAAAPTPLVVGMLELAGVAHRRTARPRCPPSRARLLRHVRVKSSRLHTVQCTPDPLQIQLDHRDRGTCAMMMRCAIKSWRAQPDGIFDADDCLTEDAEQGVPKPNGSAFSTRFQRNSRSVPCCFVELSWSFLAVRAKIMPMEGTRHKLADLAIW